MITDQIKALEAQLKAARELEKAEHDARRRSVRPTYRFTFTPVEDAFYGVRDGSGVTIYRLNCTCDNAEECKQVGRDPFTGGMDYYVNTSLQPHRIVCSTGGGNIYIETGRWARKPENRAKAERQISGLEQFITEHPEGGDVTTIIDYKLDEER